MNKEVSSFLIQIKGLEPWKEIYDGIEQLQKKAELGEHYKHLYSEVKKQKDDVVEYIKSLQIYGLKYGKTFYNEVFNGILRMLGETE